MGSIVGMEGSEVDVADAAVALTKLMTSRKGSVSPLRREDVPTVVMAVTSTQVKATLKALATRHEMSSVDSVALFF